MTSEREKALWAEARAAQARLAVAMDLLVRLTNAASAVIARWDTPTWADAEPTAHVMNRMRAVVADALGDGAPTRPSVIDHDKSREEHPPSDTSCAEKPGVGL